jgi:hypothetical protein
MKVEAAYGDVVDRVTILLLKEHRVADPGKLAHVRAELAALREAWRTEGLPAMESLAAWDRLAAVNAALWEVEDALRVHEATRDFGGEFVAKARSVYVLNDERAALKRQLNEALGSPLTEVKWYPSGG